MKTLGVVGGGVLGNAVARGFMEHATVKVFDNIKERATHSIEEVATCDIVMICLPTPAKADGVCDTTAIDDFLDDADRNGWWRGDRCYVIRSTTPIGFTRATSERHGLPLLHSPEFLTARCAVTDFQIPARNLIGFCTAATGNHHYILKGLYDDRFPGVPCLLMTSDETELVKLACNAFFATKVTFFNVIQRTAKLHKMNWDAVREGIMSDGRIAHAHTSVPGPSGEFGYGGMCLPKDIASLRHRVPVGLQGFLLAVEETNAVLRVEPPPKREPQSQIDALIAVAKHSDEQRANDRREIWPGVKEALNQKVVSLPPTQTEEVLRLKAQVIRMAHIASRAVDDGLRPALLSGLQKVMAEAGFDMTAYEPEHDGRSLQKEAIEYALQEANRAVAQATFKKQPSKPALRPGQCQTDQGVPLWYRYPIDSPPDHPICNETRACQDDGWMDVNGWLPLTAEAMNVHWK